MNNSIFSDRLIHSLGCLIPKKYVTADKYRCSTSYPQVCPVMTRVCVAGIVARRMEIALPTFAYVSVTCFCK